jgi:hypothetical protein
MPDETLLTAARRVVRFFNIDMQRGGIVTEHTELAMLTLDKQVKLQEKRDAIEKREAGEDHAGGST